MSNVKEGNRPLKEAEAKACAKAGQRLSALVLGAQRTTQCSVKFGMVVIPDEDGRERMLAYFQRRRGLGAVLENGFVVYNDDTDTFEKLKTVALDPLVFPQLYYSRVKRDRTEYLYFFWQPAPEALLRIQSNHVPAGSLRLEIEGKRQGKHAKAR